MYFRQIVFPPKQKIKSPIEFWFMTVTSRVTNVENLRLLGACPVCDASVIIKDFVDNENVMREALKNNPTYYIDCVKRLCPRCNMMYG